MTMIVRDSEMKTCFSAFFSFLFLHLSLFLKQACVVWSCLLNYVCVVRTNLVMSC